MPNPFALMGPAGPVSPLFTAPVAQFPNAPAVSPQVPQQGAGVVAQQPVQLPPSDRLAAAMTQLRKSEEQAAEAQAAYDRSGQLLRLLGQQNEIEPNWMGVAAAGIRGYAMKKALQRGEDAAKQQAIADAAATEAEQQATVAASDLQYQRDLYKIMFREGIKGDTDEESEWEFRRTGAMLQARANAGEQLSPEEQQTLNAYRLYIQDKNKRAALMGGVDLQSGTQKELETSAVSSKAHLNQLNKIIGEFNPEFYGLEGDLANWIGKTSMYLGDFAPGRGLRQDSEELARKRSSFDSKLYSFANELIKTRSGAAVTKQEFERFKKEFPVGAFMSPGRFEAQMKSFIEGLARRQLDRLASGQYFFDKDGALQQAETEEERKKAVSINAEEYQKRLDEINTMFERAGSGGFDELSDEELIQRAMGG